MPCKHEGIDHLTSGYLQYVCNKSFSQPDLLLPMVVIPVVVNDKPLGMTLQLELVFLQHCEGNNSFLIMPAAHLLLLVPAV